MRLTINLDDDLYAMARSHAIATKTSLSKAVGDLLRRRQALPPAPKSADSDNYFDPILGIQVSRAARPITMEGIQPGHRQITDAWLAELARRKGGKLATLDEDLLILWPDSTLLIPV